MTPDVLEQEQGLVLKPARLKSIRAIFEDTPFIREQHGDYLGKKLSGAKDVAELFRFHFRFLCQETKEHFVCLHLDQKNRVVCFDPLCTGSLSGSILHPREVFKSALLSSAAALIFVHPSGDPTPSREDIDLTKRLKECGELLGIRVMDHIIIGEQRHVSFADMSLID